MSEENQKTEHAKIKARIVGITRTCLVLDTGAADLEVVFDGALADKIGPFYRKVVVVTLGPNGLAWKVEIPPEATPGRPPASPPPGGAK
jgi:hypothetical protein